MAKRGFKANCEKLAAKYRSQLSLGPTAPLNPRDLAVHLGVQVWMPESIPELPLDTLRHLTETDGSSWSAVTICHLNAYLIILNSSHSIRRQNNDLAHELSHIICNHKPARLDPLEDGLMMLSSYNSDQEEEADWLGAALLLPRIALEKAKKSRHSDEKIAENYAVSIPLVKMRVNTTGIKKQIGYYRKRRTG